MKRRELLRHGAHTVSLLLPGLAASHALARSAQPAVAQVHPEYQLSFPRDFGAHPDFRTEWWYVTGWLQTGSRWIGMQLTFFRSRTGHSADNPSRFAPQQLVLAHAALALESEGKLRHAQRAGRQGFGLAQSSLTDTDVQLFDWYFKRGSDDRYRTRIETEDFGFELEFTPDRAPVLQGRNGLSRKGPQPEQASHYYSRPQLRATGQVRIGNRQEQSSSADGIAWLDHEWSSEYLAAQASGWDWCGLNLDDGSALMAFRIRNKDQTVLWADASLISAGSTEKITAQPRFEPIRSWRSLRSKASYPVAMRVIAFGRRFELIPLFDDQELDTLGSTGTIYWEGAVRVHENGQPVGRGYLELTGYAGALAM